MRNRKTLLSLPENRRSKKAVLVVGTILFIAAGYSRVYSQVEVVDVRTEKGRGELTITVEATQPLSYSSFTLSDPPRLVVDIREAILKKPVEIDMEDAMASRIICFQYKDSVIIVVNLAQSTETKISQSGKKLFLYLSLPSKLKRGLIAEERTEAKGQERKLLTKKKAEEQAQLKEAKRLERKAEEQEEETWKKAEEQAQLKEAKRLERKAEEEEEEAWKKAEEKAIKRITEKVGKKTKLKARELAEAIEQAEAKAAKEAREREQKMERHLRQGESYYRAGRFGKAVKELEEVLILDPGNKQAKDYLARAKKEEEAQLIAVVSDKREKEAKEEELRKEREKEEKIAEQMARGKRYYSQGLFTEAIAEWEKVLPLTVPSNVHRQEAEKLIHKARLAKTEMEHEDTVRRYDQEREEALLTADKSWLLPEKKIGEGKVVGLVKPKGEETEAKRRLREKIMRPISLDFDDAHLRDVLRYLAKIGDINIVLDETVFLDETISLEEEAVYPEERVVYPEGTGRGEIVYPERTGRGEMAYPEGTGRREIAYQERAISPRVTIHLKEVPLIEALSIILRAKGLSYRLEENLIWITTAGRIAAEEMVTKVYHLSTGISRPVGFEARGIEEEVTE